jgi:hypothetical protein
VPSKSCSLFSGADEEKGAPDSATNGSSFHALAPEIFTLPSRKIIGIVAFARRGCRR